MLDTLDDALRAYRNRIAELEAIVNQQQTQIEAYKSKEEVNVEPNP